MSLTRKEFGSFIFAVKFHRTPAPEPRLGDAKLVNEIGNEIGNKSTQSRPSTTRAMEVVIVSIDELICSVGVVTVPLLCAVFATSL